MTDRVFDLTTLLEGKEVGGRGRGVSEQRWCYTWLPTGSQTKVSKREKYMQININSTEIDRLTGSVKLTPIGEGT